MKVYVEKLKFEPIELKIIIESKEELNNLTSLIGSGTKVPFMSLYETLVSLGGKQ